MTYALFVVDEQGLHVGRKATRVHKVQDAKCDRAFSVHSQSTSSMLISPGIASCYEDGGTFGGHSASRLMSIPSQRRWYVGLARSG